MDKELLRQITQPSHYDSRNTLDVIDFCHQYDISFSRGNVIKYLTRAGRKDNELEDLNKALEYFETNARNITSSRKEMQDLINKLEAAEKPKPDPNVYIA